MQWLLLRGQSSGFLHPVGLGTLPLFQEHTVSIFGVTESHSGRQVKYRQYIPQKQVSTHNAMWCHHLDSADRSDKYMYKTLTRYSTMVKYTKNLNTEQIS